MPESKKIIVNTGPLIALTAALGYLDILKQRYKRVIVPGEVASEILQDNASRFAAGEFQSATWIETISLEDKDKIITASKLDPGESAVIRTALQMGINLVCIDEIVGRRVARLCGLEVTGSLGILLKAKKEGNPIKVKECIINMRNKGIWISAELEKEVLVLAGEI